MAAPNPMDRPKYSLDSLATQTSRSYQFRLLCLGDFSYERFTKTTEINLQQLRKVIRNIYKHYDKCIQQVDELVEAIGIKLKIKFYTKLKPI